MNVYLGIFPFADDIQIQTDCLKNSSLFINYRKIRAHESMSDENSEPEINEDKKLRKTK